MGEIMENYEKLIEMDTDNDSNVQLQLYKECLAGAGEGKKEAMEWLKLSAENGNEEAIGILDSINNESNKSDDDKYSKMPMMDLLRISDYDYYAAKELYYNRGSKITHDERVNYLIQLCKFEEASCNDYENLAKEYYYCIYEKIKNNEEFLGLCEKAINACDNAIELGSRKAKMYLASISVLLHSKDLKIFEICNQAAVESDIYNKFLHYIAMKNGIINVPNLRYLRAWEEEFDKDIDFLNTKLGKFYNFVNNNDISTIKNTLKTFYKETYSDQEALIMAMAFNLCDPNDAALNNYYDDPKCLDYIYFLYLYNRHINNEKEKAEFERVAKENERKQKEAERIQQEYKERQIKKEKERERIQAEEERKQKKRKNKETFAKITAILSIIIGAISIVTAFLPSEYCSYQTGYILTFIGVLLGLIACAIMKDYYWHNIAKIGIRISCIGIGLLICIGILVSIGNSISNLFR